MKFVCLMSSCIRAALYSSLSLGQAALKFFLSLASLNLLCYLKFSLQETCLISWNEKLHVHVLAKKENLLVPEMTGRHFF